jgi:hypothetical protein
MTNRVCLFVVVSVGTHSGHRRSAGEHAPTDVVPESLVVQDELTDRIGQLFALPQALQPARVVGPVAMDSCTDGPDGVGGGTEFVRRDMSDGRRLTCGVGGVPGGTT